MAHFYIKKLCMAKLRWKSVGAGWIPNDLRTKIRITIVVFVSRELSITFLVNIAACLFSNFPMNV